MKKMYVLLFMKFKVNTKDLSIKESIVRYKAWWVDLDYAAKEAKAMVEKDIFDNRYGSDSMHIVAESDEVTKDRIVGKILKYMWEGNYSDDYVYEYIVSMRKEPWFLAHIVANLFPNMCNGVSLMDGKDYLVRDYEKNN